MITTVCIVLLPHVMRKVHSLLSVEKESQASDVV